MAWQIYDATFVGVVQWGRRNVIAMEEERLKSRMKEPLIENNQDGGYEEDKEGISDKLANSAHELLIYAVALGHVVLDFIVFSLYVASCIWLIDIALPDRPANNTVNYSI